MLLASSIVGLLATASAVSADVARLQVASLGDERGPATVHVVVTPRTGAARWLGPFTTAGVPAGLLASPDGAHLLLLPYDDGNGSGVPTVVPVAGGPAAPLTLPRGLEIANPVSQVSWSPDGGEIVIGDAIRTPPDTPAGRSVPGTPPSAGTPPDDAPLSGAVLRCPVATRVCAEVPGPAGSAVGVPGGVLVSSSLFSLVPAAYLLSNVGDGEPGDETAVDSPEGRLARSVHDTRVDSVTHVEAAGTRVVGRFSGRPADGLPYTFGLVGGTSGAIAVRYTLTTHLRTRHGKILFAEETGFPRLLVAGADGTGRTGPLPRIPVARRDLRGNAGAPGPGPLRLPVVPALGRPEGGWIGFGVRDPVELVGHEVLATMTADGRARTVRIGGRAATPATLVAAVSPLGRPIVVRDFSLIGYERSTRSAVVHVQWVVDRGRRTEPVREVALRVPLEGGGRPRVVPRGADAAW